jgi:ParB family chromosome partitioning protein
VSIALKPDYATPYGRVYPAPQEDGTEDYDPADLARAGARVILDFDGELRVERGLVDPATIKAAQRKAQGAERPVAGLSETIVADLTAHRTAALRLELARRPDIALAATVHALALRLVYNAYDVVSCLDLDGDSRNLETAVSDVFECGAHGALATLMQSWTERLPDPCALWDWCLAQEQSVLLDLLALLAGLSVDAVTRTAPDHGQRIAHADTLASVLALDMHAHWTPATEGFFSRLSKAQMAVFLKAEGAFDQAALAAKAKKTEAAQRTAKVLLAKGWLPQPLLMTPPCELSDDEADLEAEGNDDAEDDTDIEA